MDTLSTGLAISTLIELFRQRDLCLCWRAEQELGQYYVVGAGQAIGGDPNISQSRWRSVPLRAASQFHPGKDTGRSCLSFLDLSVESGHLIRAHSSLLEEFRNPFLPARATYAEILPNHSCCSTHEGKLLAAALYQLETFIKVC